MDFFRIADDVADGDGDCDESSDAAHDGGGSNASCKHQSGAKTSSHPGHGEMQG